jgi:hypothetical protein
MINYEDGWLEAAYEERTHFDEDFDEEYYEEEEMPYGDIHPETATWLREAGYDMAWQIPDDDPDPELNSYKHIDIVIGGALDESFPINDTYDHNDIVEVIANHLKLNPDLDDWEVSCYYPEGDTLIERSQHP